jgi:proteasome accessory factor B
MQRPLLNRLNVIQDRLRRAHRVTAGLLARELGVTRRTLQRDLDLLRDDYGAPIRYDAAKRSLVLTDKTWSMPGITLNEGELLGLALGAALAAQYRGTPLAKHLWRLFGKLRSHLTDPIEFDPGLIAERLSFFSGPQHPLREDVWRAVVRALRSGRRLAIEYQAAGYDTPANVSVDPQHLACHVGDWYLLGWRPDRGEQRVYALWRIRSARVTALASEAPPFDDAKALDGRFARFLPLGRESLAVRVRLDANCARHALEVHWHPEQKVQRHRDGSATLSLPIPSELEALAWVLRLGRGAKVLGPATLKQRVEAELRAMLEAYADGTRRERR